MSLKNVNEEILAVIKKSMPEQVGSELKALIEKAERDAKDVEVLSQELREKNQLFGNASASIRALEEKVADYEARVLKEEDLKERERLLEISILKTQLEAEASKSEFARGVAMGLVRNTEFRKHVFDSESHPGYQNGPNWVQPGNIVKTLDQKESAE